VSKKLFYKIGEACKLLDIQPYVLRYWETEFPFLSPGKSKSGQRVYSAKEIEIIRRIKALLYDEGYTIAGAKKRLESDLPGILQSDSIDDLEIDEEVLVARLKAPAGEAAAEAPRTSRPRRPRRRPLCRPLWPPRRPSRAWPRSRPPRLTARAP
jgi:DNA-binding transcriptional MerR regulator